MENITNHISKSFKFFADHLIDYAGLFPPASLDLSTAFGNYLSYLKKPNSWMLSRFIIPARRLPELSSIIKEERIDFDQIVTFSVLGSGGVDEMGFFNGLKNDIDYIESFEQKLGNKVEIEVYDVRLPADLQGDPDVKSIRQFIDHHYRMFESGLDHPVKVFYEVNPDINLQKIIKAVWYHNKFERVTGYKLRTGRADVSAIPSAEMIADAIDVCRQYEVPMKFTAGLQQPIRHYDESLKTKLHGFINVFSAGIFAYCHNISGDLILEMIDDEDPDDFTFKENSFAWKNLYILPDEVKRARNKFMISFSSFSLDMLLEDLSSIKLYNL
ncbi:MAG: hypothetical protein ABSF32_11330 [Ignavibacteria bacterium]|jgi:hypothetical protein